MTRERLEEIKVGLKNKTVGKEKEVLCVALGLLASNIKKDLDAKNKNFISKGYYKKNLDKKKISLIIRNLMQDYKKYIRRDRDYLTDYILSFTDDEISEIDNITSNDEEIILLGWLN